MSDVLGSAKLVITLDPKQVQDAMLQINSSIDSTGEHVKGMAQIFAVDTLAEWGRMAFEAISRVAEGIVEMGERGTQIQEVSNGFEGLALGVHSTADVMLGALREGTQGTIANFDLMKMGAKILGTGVVQTGEQMKTLAEGAKMLSERTGTDLKEAFDVLSGAMVTGRTNGLKHLGLMVDSKAATQAFAEAHGKTTKQLTDAEKATAVSAATLAVLKKQLGDGAGGALKFGELVAQAAAAVQNFKDQIALNVSLSPVLLAGMNAAGAAISAAFGPQQKGIIAAVVAVVEKLAIGVGYVAEIGVTVAQALSRTWEALVIIFNGSAAAWTRSIGVIVGGLASMDEAIAKVTGSAAIAKTAASIRDTATALNGLSAGFQKNIATEMDAADKRSEALERVKGVVVSVTNAMVAAEGKTAAAAAAVIKPIKGIGDSTSTMVDLAKKNFQKIADEILKLNEGIDLATKQGMARRLQEIENEKQSEIQKAKELTGGVGAEYTKLVALISQKAALQAQAAKTLGTDKMRQEYTKLVNDLSLLTKTGVDKRLAELRIGEAEEIASLQREEVANGVSAKAEIDLVTKKYAELRRQAQGMYQSVEQQAAAAGFQTRAQLQETARVALDTYNQMKASNKFTTAEMQKAWEDMEKKKQEATASGATFQKVTLADLAGATSQFLTSVFGKSKAAAIAGAVIDLAAAVIKTFKQFGWPAGIPMAAAMTAAGLAQIAKIRSQSFSTGTANLDYQSFGRVAPAFLHGNEAVIPQGGGHKLAGEIASSMKNRPGSDQHVRELRGLRADIQAQTRLMKKQWLLSPATA